MKKSLLALLFLAFFIVNIMCSKSNDVRPTKQNATTELSSALVVGSGGLYDTSGTFTPTISVFGISGAAALPAHFIRVGNEVTVDGKFSWQSSTSAGGTGFVNLTVPIPYTFLTGNLEGTFVAIQTISGASVSRTPYALVGTSSGGGQATFQFTSVSATTTGVVTYHYAYTITPVQ